MAPNVFRGRAAPVAVIAALSLSLAACGGGGGGSAPGDGSNGGTIGGGGGYSLELSASSVTLEADRNAPMRPATTVTAHFVGDGLVAGYPPGVSAPGWLSVSIGTPSGGSAAIVLGTNTTGLAPGEYRTTVRVVTGKADGSVGVYKDIAVAYVVHAGLATSTTPIAFSSFDGVAAPPRTITLSSDVLPKAWTLSVTPIGTASDWVVLATTSGTLTSATCDVQIGAAPRRPGSYMATLVLKDDAGQERARVNLDYYVAPSFSLNGTLSTRVTESATLASLDLPLALTTKLDAATGAGHGWQATTSADWVSVVPASGDLSADATLAVRLDPAKLWALPNGYYNATITVSAQGGGTTASVPLSLNLALAPALTAPATVSWTIGAAATAADLSTSTSAISTNAGEAFAGHGAWHASTTAPWLQVTPSSAADAGRLTLTVVESALAGLANGAQAATVTLTADDPRVAGKTFQAIPLIALPDVAYVAPYTAWTGRAPAVILRGSGFGTGGTLLVRFGSDTATGTVVSDTDVRVTAPAQASAGRVPVSIPNALGIARRTSELLVLDPPGYAATTISLPTSPTRMILDPERQAVLLSGTGAEVRRLRFASGVWSQDAFQAPAVTGGYLTADGKTLFVTSGNTSSTSQVFYEADPATLQIRKQTGYATYYARYDLAAGFNDGRLLVINSEQWADSVWYPSLANGLYVDAHGPFILVTRDRSRMIVADDGAVGISSYDVADAAMKKRAITQRPWSGRNWSVSGDGGRLAIQQAIYDRDFNFLGNVSTPEGVVAVAVSPDGATLYALDQAQDPATSAWYWVLRRASIGGAPPYAADATPLSIPLAPTESPIAMAVSEDGGTLFLLTRAPTGSTGTMFRAVPLN